MLLFGKMCTATLLGKIAVEKCSGIALSSNEMQMTATGKSTELREGDRAALCWDF